MNLSAAGRRHRVELLGASTRTLTWDVDDQLVAQQKSSQDDVHLQPGDGLGRGLERSDVGTIHAKFTGLGRSKRVTWFPGRGAVSTTARACPEPAGSISTLSRAHRPRSVPNESGATPIGTRPWPWRGIANVGIPVLLGFLAVRWTVSLPWPDLNLPSIPWPDWDLPSIPWPDWDLPVWAAPAWVSWLVDHVRYVWPVILAGFFARTEIERQRQQDALKAQPGAESVLARTSLAAPPQTGLVRPGPKGRPRPFGRARLRSPRRCAGRLRWDTVGSSLDSSAPDGDGASLEWPVQVAD